MQLENIKQPFHTLSAQDRLNIVLTIRLSRRTHKTPPKVERTKRTSVQRQDKIQRAINNISPEEALKLLQDLGVV